MTAAEIALLLETPLEGDGAVELSGGAPLEAAGTDELAFVESVRLAEAATASRAGCLIVPLDFPAVEGRPAIRVRQPRNAFARALRALHPARRPAPGVHPTAIVAATAELGEEVHVGPFAAVGDGARIGARTSIGHGATVGDGVEIGPDGAVHAGARLYPGVCIGARALIHAGAVLGADGFGFTFEGGRYEKFPQVGGVRIGDDVEIGANSCIDRGALGDTVLGDGVKLDNLVHIGHNCRLGNHVVIAAQTGLAGGVTVEDYVVMGGQVGIADKAWIGAQAILGAQAGIVSNQRIAPKGTYWGTPARPHREHLRKLAHVERLPEALAKLKDLERRLGEEDAK